ncbi:cytochrome P450 [Mycena vulgaris]|nr:cytochrome P450 [Mycena vulgaris]
MSPSLGSTSLWAIPGLLIILSGLRWTRQRSRLPLPPGPAKLPIVGNLFDIPSERHWETLVAWSRQYNSDIVQVDVLGMSVVVLSSLDAIKELFGDRSSIYSDRPRLPMIVELMGWDFGIGDRWRSYRKLFHEAFNEGAARHFHLQERAAAHGLLRRLLSDPRDVMDHFKHMAAALIMDVTYGIDVLPANDPYIAIVKKALNGVETASVPGAFLVDVIPALKYVPSWFPGAGFKRKAAEWNKATRDLLRLPFEQAKRNIAAGTSPSSFVSLRLGALEDAKNDDNGAQEAAIEAVAANMYGAGALGTFALAMLANPDAQKKAQAELDSVLANGSLPDFTDEESLPYTTALVKEVMRWKPVTPIAIPHCLAVDDEYRGYRIPAGSIVMANAWAILHDEEMYPEPHVFKPERFLLDGKINPAVRDPEVAAFGFGRRVCPGRYMASSSLWIAIASILATMDIKKARDDHGNEIEPSYEYVTGMLQTPLHFECSITPRSRQAEEAIQATSGDA